MRYIVADCATRSDHPIHVSDPRPSMYQCVDGLEIRICPGGRLGDRRIRQAHDIAALAEEVRVEQVARSLADMLTSATPPPAFRGRTLPDDDEPDYEAILEARAEARAEEAIERAEREYERYVYGD